MPIKPENKKRYPANWKEISLHIRTNRAKNKCEFCKIRNYDIIKRLDDGEYRHPSQCEWDTVNDYLNNGYSMLQALKLMGLTKIVLTVAHLDHNPSNCDYSNLRALCQYCHNKYDRKHRNETRKNSKLKNQLKLF